MTLFNNDSFGESFTERPIKNSHMPIPVVVEPLDFDCFDTYLCNIEDVNTYLQFFHNQLHNSVLRVKSIVVHSNNSELKIFGIPDCFLTLFLMVILTDGFLSSLESKHLFIDKDCDSNDLSISINNFESSLNDCLALLDRSLPSKKFNHYLSFLKDEDKLDFILPFFDMIGYSFDAKNLHKSINSTDKDNFIDWDTTLSVSLNLKTQTLGFEQFDPGSITLMIRNTLISGESFSSRFNFDLFKNHVLFSNVNFIKQVSSALSFCFANLYSAFSLNEKDEELIIASCLENFIISLPSVDKLDAGFSNDLSFYDYDREMKAKLSRERIAQRRAMDAEKKLARQKRRNEKRLQDKIKLEQEEKRKTELRLKRQEQEALEELSNTSNNQGIENTELADNVSEMVLEEQRLKQQSELIEKEHYIQKINYILNRKSEIVDALKLVDDQLSVGNFTNSAEAIKWYRSLKRQFETLSSEFDSLNDVDSFTLPQNIIVDIIFHEDEFDDYFESIDNEYTHLNDRLSNY